MSSHNCIEEAWTCQVVLGRTNTAVSALAQHLQIGYDQPQSVGPSQQGGALPDPGYYSLKDPTVYSLMLVGAMLQGLSVSWQDIAWCFPWLWWWMLLSKVSGWSRVGLWLGLIMLAMVFSGGVHLSVWGLFRAVDRQAVSRRVSRHVSRHVCRSRSPVLGVVCFALVGAVLFWSCLSGE